MSPTPFNQYAIWETLLLPALHKSSLTNEARREIVLGLVEAKKISNNDGDPPVPGFYRWFSGKGSPRAVAFFHLDDTDPKSPLVGFVDGEQLDPIPPKLWQNCVNNPIPYEWYDAKVERGEKWPDEADLGDGGAGIGHNNPPEETETDLERMTRTIETAVGAADTYKKIVNDDNAAAAVAARSRLLELSGSADKKREAEKAPHWDACKKVDNDWKPIIKLAKDKADEIRTALSAYETMKFRMAQEEARKRAEAAAAAAPPPDQQGEAVLGPPPTAAEPAPAPASTIKGASGRAATVRTVKIAVVVDQDAAYQDLKAIAELKTLIQKLAQRAVDEGRSVAGVTVEEQRKVA